MTLQLSTAARTAAAQGIADILNTTPTVASLVIYSGAVPADCAAADPAGELASGDLPTTCLTAASGALTKAGTWALTGSAAGDAASFRIFDDGGVCTAQGDVTATGGGGVMEIDNVTIAIGQAVNVTAVTITIGGA